MPKSTKAPSQRSVPSSRKRLPLKRGQENAPREHGDQDQNPGQPLAFRSRPDSGVFQGAIVKEGDKEKSGKHVKERRLAEELTLVQKPLGGNCRRPVASPRKRPVQRPNLAPKPPKNPPFRVFSVLVMVGYDCAS